MRLIEDDGRKVIEPFGGGARRIGGTPSRLDELPWLGRSGRQLPLINGLARSPFQCAAMPSRDGVDEGCSQGSGGDVVPGRIVEAGTPIRLSPLTLPTPLARAVFRTEQSTDTPRTQQLLPPDP